MLEPAPLTTEKKVACYHCGNPCEDLIQHEEKHFCCQGCKTVFLILKENNLDSYYIYENTPGTRVIEDQGKFSFLQNQQIQQLVLDYQSETQSIVTFSIPAIHCSSCIYLLENLHKLNQGVISSVVNFVKKEVKIRFNPTEVTLIEIAELLNKIGYSPNITAESINKPPKKKSYTLVIKLGIAAFCFGNIMLISFPEYLGSTNSVEEEYQSFFSWVNLLLALPVVFYSASDYFVSAFKSLRSRFLNIDFPIAIGVLALFFRSTYEVISATGPGYFDSLAGLIFFLLIGKWFQSKTYETLNFERDFKSYFPLAVKRIDKKGEEMVMIADLKKSDRIVVRNDEVVPADSILLSEGASIDYSFVTGESVQYPKKTGEYIYAGGRQKGSSIVLEIQKDVSQSYLTGLWNKDYETQKEPTSKFIDKIAHYFTYVILIIALLATGYWYFVSPDKIWFVFTSVLIVACPCALALSVPFTYGNAVRYLGRINLFLRNAEVVEKFASIDTIVFDKTGTITEQDGNRVRSSFPLTLEEKTYLWNVTSSSFHPLSQKITRHLQYDGIKKLNIDYFQEIAGKGIEVMIEGIKIKVGSASFIETENIIEEDASTVYFSINDKTGYFLIESELRPGLKDVIKSLRNRYRLHLISGDKPTFVHRFNEIFGSDSQLHFEMNPDQKITYIENLQKKGHQVMMLGDGLNDAPALKKSDLAISVTDNIASFSPACDAILHGESFSKFDKIITFVKSAKKIVVISIIISFLYNIVGLTFAVSGILTPVFAAILMPLSSISVVAFTSIVTAIQAKRIKLI
ncbi:MAG: heavy metal translocating P-type ATPase metal-binding domain-containing protein [Cyclobacteriaceae bacterium]|nr:heavy metal translocating P-type ATPase metal-binding domain-containing protein [Cyclobacteriaceae bacterium]